MIVIDASLERRALHAQSSFGGAITQASGSVWRRLSEPLRKRVAELFFGEAGLRASLARVPIGSCDFAESSYSADDVNNSDRTLTGAFTNMHAVRTYPK